MNNFQSLILTGFILLGVVIFTSTFVFWRFNDYSQGWKFWKYKTFTLLNFDIRFVVGQSSMADEAGNPIKGKFLSLRFNILGLGFGLDYLISDNNENSV